MYQSSCNDIALGGQEAELHFSCLSSEGQSGAPVWTYEPAIKRRHLRGINIAGGDFQSGALPGTFLSITEQVYMDIKAAMSSS